MTDDLTHTAFVFEAKSDGQIVSAYADQAKKYLNDKYVHIATINPRAWIEANYSKITGSITTDNSQTLINALAEIERLKEQLKTETAMHESWQNQHLIDDGDQCRRIRELEEERDVEITQSKIYEGKLYTAENELRKLKYHSRNVVEQKLNEALTVTADAYEAQRQVLRSIQEVLK